MFCPECGTENPEHAKYCGNCRHPLDGETGQSQLGPDPEMAEIPGDSDTVPDSLKYGILAATIFIPFIGLIMGIIYLMQRDSEAKKDVGKLWLYTSLGIMLFYFLVTSGY